MKFLYIVFLILILCFTLSAKEPFMRPYDLIQDNDLSNVKSIINNIITDTAEWSKIVNKPNIVYDSSHFIVNNPNGITQTITGNIILYGEHGDTPNYYPNFDPKIELINVNGTVSIKNSGDCDMTLLGTNLYTDFNSVNINSNINMSNHSILGLADSLISTSAVTKNYVDSELSGKLSITVDTYVADWNKIINKPDTPYFAVYNSTDTLYADTTYTLNTGYIIVSDTLYNVSLDSYMYIVEYMPDTGLDINRFVSADGMLRYCRLNKQEIIVYAGNNTIGINRIRINLWRVKP